MNRDIATAQQQYDLNKAAELQYGKLPQLQKQLEAEEEKVKNQLTVNTSMLLFLGFISSLPKA